MKLKVTFEMPLQDGSDPFIEVIAKIHGWTPGGDVSAKEYICKSICEPQVSWLFRSLINGALSAYYGVSGEAQLAGVVEEYNRTHSVSAEIVE